MRGARLSGIARDDAADHQACGRLHQHIQAAAEQPGINPISTGDTDIAHGLTKALPEVARPQGLQEAGQSSPLPGAFAPPAAQREPNHSARQVPVQVAQPTARFDRSHLRMHAILMPAARIRGRCSLPAQVGERPSQGQPSPCR
ncbi:hypothetical protein CKO40_14410 [Halochromatium glycolicum]|jgi:hypothetical protein|uniref:Uncharacterized protein n=1 Tax=Halochromatium glycolicum TaxID=85075 RepID=A0AAJ0U751_9GAMM|nr:hypothetical protein [Halochromatium glycolicum]